MVAANGQVSMTIIKARFGNDIRKTSLHHGHDLTLNDLILMLQRIFKIRTADCITLKYKDDEGDLVTLGDDSDLLLALESEQVLSLEVLIDNQTLLSLSSIQQQIAQLQADIQRLAHSLASLSIPEVQNDPAINCRDQVETLRMGSQTMPPLLVNGLGDSPQQAPPSPVPSERHELPATIQPSLQEQVLPEGLARQEMPSPLEEEIPLEAGCPSVAELPLSSVQDPHITQLNNFAPIPSSIPSFPQANLPPTTTVVHQEHMPPQPPQHFPSPTQQFNHPPQQGFIPPQQCVPPSQQFGPSSQQPFASQIVSPVQPPTPQSSVSSAPLTQSTQQGFASLHQPGFAPPPQQGQGFVSPPQQGQGFAPPPQQGQGFAPSSQQGFAPPPVIPSQFAPPQQGFAPLPPQNFPPSSGFGQHQLAGHIPPSEPAPPSGAPQQFTPPPSMIPGGFAPPPRGGPTGAPGGNPFARGPGGPGYRSSSYHN